MTKLFLWSISNTGSDGDEACITDQAICSTYARAMTALANCCRRQWLEQDNTVALPADDTKAVSKYFEFWHPEKAWDIQELTLDEGVET